MASLGIRHTWLNIADNRTEQYSVQPNKDFYNLGRGEIADVQAVGQLGKDGKVREVAYLRTAAVLEGPKTAWERFKDYGGDTTNGLYQLSKGLRQTIDIINTTAKPSGEVGKVLNGARVMLGGATNFLIFPRIVGTVSKVLHMNQSTPFIKKVHAWAEMVGSVITGWIVVAPIFGKSAAGAEIAGPVCDLIADGIEGGENAKELVENSKLIQKAQAEGADSVVVDRMKEKRNLNIFKVIKAVAAVAIAIFSLLALALGAPVVPALVMLVIGLVGTIFSVTSHFYEKTRRETLSKEEVFTHVPATDQDLGYQTPAHMKILPTPAHELMEQPRIGLLPLQIDATA